MPIDQVGKNGFTSFTPVCAKSAVFRVATVRFSASADAAIRLSFTGILWPFFFKSASSRAHALAAFISKSTP